MVFTIIIFLIALALAFGLIGRRVWQMKTGKFVMDPSYEPADWTELSIEVIRTRLLEITKFGAHHTILFLLKVWMKTSYALKGCDRYVRAKLMHLLHRNGHLPVAGSPSSFLKRISEHKNTMMNAATAKEEVQVEKVENKEEIQ